MCNKYPLFGVAPVMLRVLWKDVEHFVLSPSRSIRAKMVAFPESLMAPMLTHQSRLHYRADVFEGAIPLRRRGARPVSRFVA